MAGAQLGFCVIQGNAVVQLDPLQTIGSQVNRVEQRVDFVGVFVFDLEFRDQELEEPEQFFPGHNLVRHDRSHLPVDLHELLGLDLEIDLGLILQLQFHVEALNGDIDQHRQLFGIDVVEVLRGECLHFRPFIDADLVELLPLSSCSTLMSVAPDRLVAV